MLRSTLLVACTLPLTQCEETAPPPFDGATTADVEVRDARDARETEGEATDVVADGVPCRELTGPVALSTKADLTQLEHARVVRGDLVLTPAEGLWDQEVRELTGSLTVTGSADAPVGAQLAFVGLSSVGGDVALAHTTKGLVDLYRLETIGGSLTARSGGWAFWTPRLTTISGAIDVRDASHLALTLDDLAVFGGPLRIERARGLTSVSLGRITRLRTSGEAVRLVDNPDLTSLRLGALATLEGDLRITGNARLSRATIDQALAGIIVTGATTICGNLDDEACP
ncbi:MAG: hypothetical protein IT385_22720 [Deltaproteobacteria bacterium]|nr:hypothetical protein [Deltaproteobacteria bacterium]